MFPASNHLRQPSILRLVSRNETMASTAQTVPSQLPFVFSSSFIYIHQTAYRLYIAFTEQEEKREKCRPKLTVAYLKLGSPAVTINLYY